MSCTTVRFPRRRRTRPRVNRLLRGSPGCSRYRNETREVDELQRSAAPRLLVLGEAAAPADVAGERAATPSRPARICSRLMDRSLHRCRIGRGPRRAVVRAGGRTVILQETAARTRAGCAIVRSVPRRGALWSPSCPDRAEQGAARGCFTSLAGTAVRGRARWCLGSSRVRYHLECAALMSSEEEPSAHEPRQPSHRGEQPLEGVRR